MTSAHKDFKYRHIGTSSADQLLMLKTLGYESLDALMSDAVPQVIRFNGEGTLPDPISEPDALGDGEAGHGGLSCAEEGGLAGPRAVVEIGHEGQAPRAGGGRRGFAEKQMSKVGGAGDGRRRRRVPRDPGRRVGHAVGHVPRRDRRKRRARAHFARPQPLDGPAGTARMSGALGPKKPDHVPADGPS